MSTAAARQLRRFTAREYEQMVAAGVFIERGRVELLGGEIIEMAAMGLAHATYLNNFDYLLKRQVPQEYRVNVQVPILLDDASEPEPDLVVYRRRKRSTYPTAGEILLVVEIADRSLDYDRNQKFPCYAAAGIPEAWLFDLFAGVLERHTEPYAGRYCQLVTAGGGETLASTTLPAVLLAVDAILADDDG
jgi:Uma2 family endonuclease